MATTAFRPGATALITGAASGIGFAVARLCRTYNMNLVLVDLHADYLAEAHAVLSDTPTEKTITHVMDVSDGSSWEFLLEKVSQYFPTGIDFLMLNAGAAFKPASGKGPWADPEYFTKAEPVFARGESADKCEQTFATNINGVINGISAFLPSMSANSQSPDAGHKAIVITGSKQGITNPPGGQNPAYNASKSAVKSLAEHLAHDLRSNPATKNFSVHLLVPGWTYTAFSGNPGPVADTEVRDTKPSGAWLPSQVAGYMYEKVEGGVFYIICPDDDVSEAMDKARMTWAIGDVTAGRPALSRWEEGWKDRASEWIDMETERLASHD